MEIVRTPKSDILLWSAEFKGVPSAWPVNGLPSRLKVPSLHLDYQVLQMAVPHGAPFFF